MTIVDPGANGKGTPKQENTHKDCFPQIGSVTFSMSR